MVRALPMRPLRLRRAPTLLHHEDAPAVFYDGGRARSRAVLAAAALRARAGGVAAIAAGLWLLTGCGAPPADDRAPLLVFASDFQRYPTWSVFSIANAPADGVAHAAGDRKIFLNKMPPPGATEFAVGTFIVKEIHAADPAASRTFARAKVGGDYNPTGTPNWESFELQWTSPPQTVRHPFAETSADVLWIAWYGYGPPSGDTYGGDPNGCKGCHASARAFDFVLSTPLQVLLDVGGGHFHASAVDASFPDGSSDAAPDVSSDVSSDAFSDAAPGHGSSIDDASTGAPANGAADAPAP